MTCIIAFDSQNSPGMQTLLFEFKQQEIGAIGDEARIQIKPSSRVIQFLTGKAKIQSLKNCKAHVSHETWSKLELISKGGKNERKHGNSYHRYSCRFSSPNYPPKKEWPDILALTIYTQLHEALSITFFFCTAMYCLGMAREPDMVQPMLVLNVYETVVMWLV